MTRNRILAQQYHDILFNEEELTTIEVFPLIAEIAVQLRATYKLQIPDSIQMVTASKFCSAC